jgi:hypothetical protein
MSNPGPVAKQGSETLSATQQRLGVVNQWSKIIRNSRKILPLGGTKLIQVLLNKLEQGFGFVHSNSLTSEIGID